MKKLFILIFLLIGIINLGESINESRILEIRKEYNKTNAEKNLKVKKEEIDVDFEGNGDRRIYTKNGVVRKIVIRHYGEPGKRVIEYYIKNGKIYFVFDVIFYTNYLPGKSGSKDESRFYFDENENLIRYIDENGEIIEDEYKLYELQNGIENPWNQTVIK